MFGLFQDCLGRGAWEGLVAAVVCRGGGPGSWTVRLRKDVAVPAARSPGPFGSRHARASGVLGASGLGADERQGQPLRQARQGRPRQREPRGSRGSGHCSSLDLRLDLCWSVICVHNLQYESSAAHLNLSGFWESGRAPNPRIGRPRVGGGLADKWTRESLAEFWVRFHGLHPPNHLLDALRTRPETQIITVLIFLFKCV